MDEYRGETRDINTLFTHDQQEALLEWFTQHHIRGAPVRFRLALGQPALGWKNDVEHSNIAHAGYRDQVIYIGQTLLQYLFTPGNEALRSEVLDQDEFRHLIDEDFTHSPNDPAYRARLDAVGSAVNSFIVRDGGEKKVRRPDLPSRWVILPSYSP